MNVKSLKSVFKLAKRWTRKHAPEILVGTGVIGMVTAVATAVKETPVAEQKIEEAQEEKGEELTVVEKVKATWKTYLPTAILVIVSAGCIIGASSVNLKRNAALATAYSLAEKSVNDLQKRHLADMKLLKDNGITPPPEPKVDGKEVKPAGTPVVVINKGEEMFIDGLTGTPFSSTMADIKNRVAKLNTDMANSFSGSCSLNEYLFAMHGGSSDIGDDLGWNPSKDGRIIEVDFIPTVDDEGKLAWKVVNLNPPFHNYI